MDIIQAVNDALEGIVKVGSKLKGAPGYVLVFIICLGTGFLFKRAKWFAQNGAIPYLVVASGMIWNVLLADPFAADRLPFRLWLFSNAAFGAVIGLIAWGIHYNRRRIPILKMFFKDDEDSNPRAFVKSEMKDSPSQKTPGGV